MSYFAEKLGIQVYHVGLPAHKRSAEIFIFKKPTRLSFLLLSPAYVDICLSWLSRVWASPVTPMRITLKIPVLKDYILKEIFHLKYSV